MHKLFLIFISLIYSTFSYEYEAISPKKWVKPHSPYYDAARNKLFFVDLANGTIINYDLANKIIHEVNIPGIVTPAFVHPLKCKTDQFIAGNHLSVTKFQWDTVSTVGQIIQEMFTVDTAPELMQNNYLAGKISPQGKFFGGTYRRGMCGDTPPTHGTLYSYDKCNGVKHLAADFKVTGGFEWNAEGNKFYFIDSCNRTVRAYDYNGQTGKISNPRIVFTYTGGYGDPVSTIPLGMTVDKKGLLYIALYYGGAVLVVDPSTGNIVEVIYLPAQVIGSVAWGGANYDILFVTTYSSVRNIFTGATENIPFTADSGRVFMVTGLNAVGFATHLACF